MGRARDRRRRYCVVLVDGTRPWRAARAAGVGKVGKELAEGVVGRQGDDGHGRVLCRSECLSCGRLGRLLQLGQLVGEDVGDVVGSVLAVRRVVGVRFVAEGYVARGRGLRTRLERRWVPVCGPLVFEPKLCNKKGKKKS